MRYFFYSSFIVILLGIIADKSYALESFADVCPYGYEGNTLYDANTTNPECEGSHPDFYYICVYSHSIEYYGGVVEDYYDYEQLHKDWCKNVPLDDTKETGCYPTEVASNSSGGESCFGEDLKECNSSSRSYFISQGKNCSDYCVGDNPYTESIFENVSQCSLVDGEQLSDPNDDPQQCPPGQIYDELTGSCLDDCNGFPCDDPGNDPDDGSGDDSGGGDSAGGDSGGGDTGGDIPDDTADGDSASSCDSAATCLDQARSNESCDYDRDMEYFTYVSGSQYFYECQYCNGPASSSYEECNLCDFGYNGDTGACYPVTCPFGDCTNPNDNNQTPESPSDDDNTQVVAAIRDLQAEIANGVDVNQLPELINIVESFKAQNSEDLESVSTSVNDNNDDNTQLILDALGELKTAVEEVPGGSGSGDGPGNTPETNENCQPDENGNMASGCVPCEPDSTGKYPSGCSDTELKDLLKKIVDIQEDIRCSVSNYSPGEEEEGVACPSPESDDEFSHEAEAGELYSAWQTTEWGQSLSSISNAADNVSSACNLDFSLYVPYANKDITAPVCQYIEPVANTLRLFAIAIWGFLGIRHIFSA